MAATFLSVGVSEAAILSMVRSTRRTDPTTIGFGQRNAPKVTGVNKQYKLAMRLTGVTDSDCEASYSPSRSVQKGLATISHRMTPSPATPTQRMTSGVEDPASR